MLTVNNLRVNYGDFTALSITSPIKIEEGDRIGIIGSNGAGKTTFVKAVCGLVSFRGNIDTKISHDDIALHLQENSYINRMPVKMIIEAVFNTTVQKNQRLMEIIEFFDFAGCLKKKFSALSGGQKQKLTIIMVLMQDKPLTFFDEVTSGLDFETRQKLMQKVAEWYKGRPNALCVVSHYYDELDHLVNKLLIIEKGRVAEYGRVDELFNKYCRRSVVVAENNPHNEELIRGYNRLAAPAHLLAVSCEDALEENKLAALFVANNVNYKRSNRDIEILFVNVLKALEVKNES